MPEQSQIREVTDPVLNEALPLTLYLGQGCLPIGLPIGPLGDHREFVAVDQLV